MALTTRDTEFFRQHAEIFACPGCGGALDLDADAFVCTGCRTTYPSRGAVPSIFSPNRWDTAKEDVTDTIKAFYEENPFPNYDDFDSVGTLVTKARRGLFARMLDEQIPFFARVIECGCGTGQLTNFLSIANRTVFGTDLCVNSLKMAIDFKERNGLERAHFLQMNLFRPCFKPGSFDLVISNGVLHHTSDPFLGFQSICSLVRPGGYILIGLYHKYGRLATDLRRQMFRLTNERLLFLDRHAVDRQVSPQKRRAWFMDQYRNPHESKHTVGEVLEWLEQVGFEFVRTVPDTVPFRGFSENDRLFEPQRVGSKSERLVVNLDMILRGHREGGFFITIARRPGPDGWAERRH